MSAMTIETAQQRSDLEIARALAMSSAVEIKHRYRMSRIEAEQETIKLRLRRNFWRSRTAKIMQFTLCVAIGLGLGVLAHSQWLLFKREVGGSAQGTTPVALAPATQTTADAGAVSGEQGKTALASTLTILDSIDVPFLRTKSTLAQNGLTGILNFAKVNEEAQKIQVTGVYGPAENPAIATERALVVVDVLIRAGMSRQSVEVMPVLPSEEDAKTISGARLSSVGPRHREAGSIQAGAPLGLGNGGMPTPFNSAFKQDATQTPTRTPDGLSEPSALSLPRQKNATNDEGESNAKELERAVKLAASRRLSERPQQKQNSSPGKENGKSEPTTESSILTGNQESKSSPGSKPIAFTIVSKLENAVLIRVGREVRHIRVGESLPDGTMLGKNLEPISPAP